MTKSSAMIIGIFLFAGLLGLGYTLGNSLLTLKGMERTVSVKGLSEREVKADIAIWPIQYVRLGNDLATLYTELERDRARIEAFLISEGFRAEEMSLGAPSIIDKLSHEYGGGEKISFRYVASQTLSLYTPSVDLVRSSAAKLSDLGKQGVVLRVGEYENQIEYLYTKLNEIKPAMIEEATLSARASAQKFAEDSKSRLGKIKSASQGQFTIGNRDKNTPYIKSVRVVSTIEYYLDD